MSMHPGQPTDDEQDAAAEAFYGGGEAAARFVRVLQNWFTLLPASRSGRHKLLNWDDCEDFLKRAAALAPHFERLADLQRGLSRLDPMQRSSPETVSCVFCGADKGHSYVTGDRTPHAVDCEWRLACEARGLPWDHVL